MVLKVAVLLFLAVTLVGCGAFSRATPTPLPTVVLDAGGVLAPTSMAGTPGAESRPSAAASGVIVPLRRAQIASVLGGNVLSVEVAIGDRVKEGQTLARLAGAERVTAELEAARMELISARVALKTLTEGADQARSAALLRLADARKALDDAQKRRAWKDLKNGSRSSIEEAEANYILAKDALDKADDYYAAFEDRDQYDVGRAAALSSLAAARKAHDRALANLNYLLALPNAIEVDKAEAEYQSALAEVTLAQAEVDKLKNGVDPDQLALAQSRVKNAEARTAAAEADLAALELKAPFAGVIGRVDVQTGDYVKPGGAVLTLIDDSRLRVETSDLSERDAPSVKAGQKASVFVKPLGRQIEGVVAEVAPLADTIGGDVVYKTIIDLDAGELEGLLAGMSVDVTFE